jgi:glycosyltransferase involved in cell wall biosynthesis
MRILHVSPYYEQAWAYGGIPRVVSTLARAQTRQGHDVTVCTTDACDAESRLSNVGAASGADPSVPGGGVDVRIFRNVSNTMAYHHQLFLPMGLSRYLRRHARDFVVAHLHGCHNVPGIIAASSLADAGIPYVLQPHGTAPLIERRRLAKWLLQATFGRNVMPKAARLIATSEAECRQLAGLGVDPRAIRVIYNPIDMTEFANLPTPGLFRNRRRLPWKEIVLYLGKMTPRKRLDVLATAFAALNRADAGLVIAGNDMGVESALRRLIDRKGLTGRTLFTGLLRGRERLEALVDATVVVYPGQHEVFGLVPIEALLCGTPVVVADDSGCGEIIRGTGGGKVAAEGDVVAFGKAMTAILDDAGSWRAAARAAGEKIAERFSDEVVCRQLEGVYEEVARPRGGAA